MTVFGLGPARPGRRGAARPSIRLDGSAAARVMVVLLATAAMIASLGSGVASAASSTSKSLDAATKRALDLEKQLQDLSAEQAALQLRLDATAQRLKTQGDVVARAQAEADRAQQALHGRAVAMYKADDTDSIALIVGAASWSELVTRASLVTRMLASDGAVLREAEAAAARARAEADALAKLQKEELALRELQKKRIASAKDALAEQKRLVATLSEAARKLLAARKAAGSASQKKWAASSLPGGSRIPKVAVTVDPYEGVAFLAADYAPKRFRATGQTFNGLASWYGKAVDGHKTASGRIFNHEDFTCAHRTLPFGTWLAVTRGERRVIVMVTDRGPYTAGRVLDLSEAAAEALGIGGVKTVNAEVVVPR